jgi:hypothetical protein
MKRGYKKMKKLKEVNLTDEEMDVIIKDLELLLNDEELIDLLNDEEREDISNALEGIEANKIFLINKYIDSLDEYLCCAVNFAKDETERSMFIKLNEALLDKLYKKEM